MWLGLVALGAVVLGLAHALAGRRPRLGSLHRQFAIGVALAVGQLVVLAAAAAQLMFVSAHDALLLMVIVVFAGVVAVRAAQLFATDAMRDIEVLRDTLVAVGEGSRAPVAVNGSADEVAELARAANTAILKLDRAERARRDLIAAVSHDLRTPITSLRLLSEAVGDDIVDAPTRQGYLVQMQTHIEILSAPDRRPVRALAARGRRHPVDDPAGVARRSSSRRRSTRCGPRPRPRASASAPTCRAARARARQPREGPARAVQPDPELDPPHAGRRVA